MKNSKFKIGDRVGIVSDLRYDGNEYDAPVLGKIIHIHEPEEFEATVVLDKPIWHDGASRTQRIYFMADLIKEKEFNKKYSKLEKEFKTLEKTIHSKMEMAGKLLLDANNLANIKGHELVNIDAIAPLFSAMKECGWNTSSLRC